MRWTKKIGFGVVAFVLPSLLLALTAEVTVRWLLTGGLGAALRSFAPGGEQRSSWLVADPDLGYRLDPAAEDVNALGIRHTELELAPAAGMKRIIVLGDSVAYDRDGFVDILRERMQSAGGGRVEVINASIPGYTTHQERLLFERDLAVLAPDLVLLQYCVNDNHRFLHQLDPGGHWIIVPEAVAGAEHGGWLPSWLEASYIVRRIRWRQAASLRNDRLAHDPFPWRDTPEFGNAWRAETWPAQEVELRALQEAVSRAGAALVIVAVPYEPQLDPRALERDRAYTLTPQRSLAEIADRLGVPLLDLHSAFVEAREQRLYRDRIHLSPAGHVLAAEEIEDFLERERLAIAEQ